MENNDNNNEINKIENNKQLYTNVNIFKNKYFKAFLCIIFVFILISATICLLYKTNINISNKYIDAFDYESNSEVVDFNFDYFKFIKYDSDKDVNTLHVSIPKEFIYKNLLKLDALNEDLINNYNINLNKFGFTCDANKPNIIDYSADITYKNFISAYIHGSIEYEFTNSNGIRFYIKSMKIGKNIPEFLYKSFLPFKDGDLIYELKSDEYEFLKNKVLMLNLISNVSTDNDYLKFDYDFMSNLKYITKYVFGEDYDTSKIETSLQKTIPILFEALFGENQDEYIKIAEKLFPFIKN